MSKNSTDTEHVIISWLNADFFENVLKSEDCDEDLKVTSCEVQRATAPGDNYLSAMYRATIQVTREGHSEKKSLIIKCLPEGEVLKEVCKICLKFLLAFINCRKTD